MTTLGQLLSRDTNQQRRLCSPYFTQIRGLYVTIPVGHHRYKGHFCHTMLILVTPGVSRSRLFYYLKFSPPESSDLIVYHKLLYRAHYCLFHYSKFYIIYMLYSCNLTEGSSSPSSYISGTAAGSPRTL